MDDLWIFLRIRKGNVYCKFYKKHGKNNRMMPLAYRGSILNKEYLLLSIFPLGIIYYIFKTRKRVSSWLDVIFVFSVCYKVLLL